MMDGYGREKPEKTPAMLGLRRGTLADSKLDFKGGGLHGIFTAIVPSGGIIPVKAEMVEVRDGKL